MSSPYENEPSQRQEFTQKGYGYSGRSSMARETVKFLTATTLGSVLLILSGLILTGTVVSLIVATPVLVLFSPVLLPAAFTVFLLASGFIFSGTCGVAALSALTWIYHYAPGHQPRRARSPYLDLGITPTTTTDQPAA